MRPAKHRHWVVWCICLILFVQAAVPWFDERTSTQPPVKKVLIINSYNTGLAWSDGELDGVRSVLPVDTDLYVEYMDSKRQSSDEYRRILFEIYRLKYQAVRFDAVVALDDDAFRFLLAHHDDLFPGVPAVFCGVNQYEPSMIAGLPWITGLVQTNDIQDTLDLAVQLRPSAEQILVITDNTTTGRINRTVLEDLDRSGRYDIPMVFLNPNQGLTLEELLQKLREAPQNSVVYYADFFHERVGVTDDPARIMTIVSAAAPGPVFVHNAMYMGAGALGGKVNQGVNHGRAAGVLVARVLNGEPIADMPVTVAETNQYMFDAVQLNRWNIDRSKLPRGSQILNEEQGFYQRYKDLIWIVAGAIILQGMIIVFLVINMTNRRKAEQALRESEQRWQFALEGSGDGVWDRNLVSNKISFSPHFYEMLGYAEGEFRDGWEEVINRLHPDDKDRVLAELQRHLRGEKESFAAEYRMRTKDGSYLWVLGRGKVMQRDGNGAPVRFVGTQNDISHRKWAEQTTLESVVRYRTLFDSMNEGAVLHDLVFDENDQPVDYVLRDVNKAFTRILGITREQAIGFTGSQVYGTGDPPFLEEFGRVALTGIPENVELYFAPMEKYFSISLYSPGPNQFATVFTDITERRKREEENRLFTTTLEQRVIERTAQLEAANRELEAFSYSVSHDLRAPLRSIDGFSLALLEDFAEKLPPESLEFLHRIRAASQRMGELIDALLKLSRVTRQEMHRVTIDLGELARAIAQEIQATNPERQVDWNIKEGLVVSADPNLLRVVLTNLLQNAWKFTSHHATARIELNREENESGPVYFVRDDGAGFDMTYSSKLFSAFQRLHTVNEFEGTGIGLATVQRIIHRHGGQVWADSAPEQGTTIFFTLP